MAAGSHRLPAYAALRDGYGRSQVGDEDAIAAAAFCLASSMVHAIANPNQRTCLCYVLQALNCLQVV